MELDESVLDSADKLIAADPGEMLRAAATSGAQVREAAILAADAGLGRLAEDGRPRAIVVLGMGGSGIAGDVLAALCGTECAVPIVVVKGYTLPGWVGANDLVCGVSCSGTTEETLSAFGEAQRRGCRLLGVGSVDSPLSFITEQGRGPFVPVRPAGRLPRAMAWGLSVPLLLAAAQLGLADVTPDVLEAAAQRLDEIAALCRPASEAFVNPGKELALAFSDTLPMVWGCSPIAAVAGTRFVCQWSENAKLPAITSAMPESNHNLVVSFDGPYGSRGAGADIFADPQDGAGRLRLLLLRDPLDEHPQVMKRAEASKDIAESRAVPVTELFTQGQSRLERLASLVVLIDYASVYTALGLGIDPTPIAAIQDLKARVAG
ncbi:MAG TPA: SIS domain-containing protein [Frankiaceae bacterium]|nr:SIS domain-containing protein [Frankiaceae bacterium]